MIIVIKYFLMCLFIILIASLEKDLFQIFHIFSNQIDFFSLNYKNFYVSGY